MTQASTAERFEIGRVVNNTWRVLQSNLVSIGLVALLLVVLPEVLLGLLQVVTHDINSARGTNIVSSVLSVMASGAITYIAVNFLNGASTTFGAAMSVGTKLFAPLWGIGFLTGLGVLVGLVLFIIPGVFLAIVWGVAGVARVMEGPGVLAAMKRSFELTRFYRWPILGVYGIIFGLVLAIVLVMVVAVVLVTMSSFAWAADVVIEPLFVAVTVAAGAAAQAAIYHELIRIKEGGGTTVAEVFA